MSYHRLISQEYFDDMTHPSLQWVQEVATAAGKHCGAIRMADESERRVPIVQMMLLRPGAVVPRHANDCHVTEVVVIGSLLLEDDEPLVVGDVIIAKPGEYHGPRVAGPDGALVATFIADVTAPVTFSEEMLMLDARISAGQAVL